LKTNQEARRRGRQETRTGRADVDSAAAVRHRRRPLTAGTAAGGPDQRIHSFRNQNTAEYVLFIYSVCLLISISTNNNLPWWKTRSSWSALASMQPSKFEVWRAWW